MTALMPMPPAAVAAVRAEQMYAAMLADARKPPTRRARAQDFTDLARFLGCGRPEVACALVCSGTGAAAAAIALGYVRSMLDRGLATATAARRVSSLKRLCKLARRLGVIDWTIEVDAPRTEAYRDTAGPGRDGWVRILAACERSALATTQGRRDLAIIRLLHDHGLRRAEVAALDLADFEPDARRLFVVGKGRGEKSPIRLNRPTLLALAGWAGVRPATADAALFVRCDRGAGPRPARLDGDGIHGAVAALGRRAGLARAVKPHGLRHQAVTRVLELSNGNIDAAQRFARHSDPKTTQRYNDCRLDLAGEMARLLGEDC